MWISQHKEIRKLTFRALALRPSELKVDPRSTFPNNFFNPQQMFLLPQADYARWKARNIDPKLETKQCWAIAWVYLSISQPLVCWETRHARSFLLKNVTLAQEALAKSQGRIVHLILHSLLKNLILEQLSLGIITKNHLRLILLLMVMFFLNISKLTECYKYCRKTRVLFWVNYNLDFSTN